MGLIHRLLFCIAASLIFFTPLQMHAGILFDKETPELSISIKNEQGIRIGSCHKKKRLLGEVTCTLNLNHAPPGGNGQTEIVYIKNTGNAVLTGLTYTPPSNTGPDGTVAQLDETRTTCNLYPSLLPKAQCAIGYYAVTSGTGYHTTANVYTTNAGSLTINILIV